MEGSTSKSGARANQARGTGKGPLHGATVGIWCRRPRLCPPHEGVGEAPMRGQRGDAALAFQAVLDTAAVGGLPELVLSVALELDAVGHAHRRAAADPVSGQLQGFHRNVAIVVPSCNRLDVRIVLLTTQLEVGSVASLARGPCAPLLVCDDHAPLIRCTCVAVKVAVDNRRNGALPVVAVHLDEVALPSHTHSITIGIDEVHRSFAASRREGVGVVHMPGRAIVLLSAAPRRETL